MALHYSPTDGSAGIDIDPVSVRHVQALETLTGRPTDDLLAEAVNDIRQKLVPSTKPTAPPKPPRRARNQSATAPAPAQPKADT